MANNELAIRFTENKYATKNEVARELKMSLIDNIWSNILSYRSNFNRYLNIRSIERSQLIICMCHTISAQNSNIETKLSRLITRKNELNPTNGDARYFRLSCLSECLKTIAHKNSINMDDDSIHTIVNNANSEANEFLYRYNEGLKFVEDKFSNQINIDFIISLYTKINGKASLDSLFRNKEDGNPDNRVLIDRIYSSAPSNLIEPMMNSLIEFIDNKDVPIFIKSLVAFYYIIYIKPFPILNDEIAVLTAKSILCHETGDSTAVYLKLEDLLYSRLSETQKRFIDVQKTADVTYFLTFALTELDNGITNLLDQLANFSAFELRKDFYQEDKIETEDSKNKEEQPVEETKDELKEIVDKKTKINPVEISSETEKSSVSIGYIPPAIDEKEAQRLEMHLLELEPFMKKKEAKFFARHCTVGKMYTIDQFKRSIGCVYETARTSMDHLAEMGYYKKQQIKNKFVYTPIVRK